jgi:hypothetical protein
MMTPSPYIPSDEAVRIARDHVLWVQQHDRGVGPGMLLAASLIVWPHEREPSWSDVVLVLAAWWDRGRAAQQLYRHDQKIILLSERRAAA